ncbi:kinesin-like protein [Chaetoceros tenuissimus]|uniref:Kinesin-like protein n=1 Tax=Chaetoceros tenuissimus TaxID=426638 RepID=A0AAD3CNZ8_9STRA|nr:kinesin-like protein [Chaetoceros tenuissimus]
MSRPQIVSEQEEEKLLLTEQYSSLQEASQSLTKKLKVLSKKYNGLKKEVKDLNAEFETERADLLDTIRELDKESALKALMIENFIPPEFISRIESQATWDENKKAWTIPKLEYTGNNIVTKVPKFKRNSNEKHIKDSESDFHLDLHYPQKASRSMKSRSDKVDPALKGFAFRDTDQEYCPYLWAKKK